MKTARIFAVALVAFALLNGALGQGILGRIVNPVKNMAVNLFKPSVADTILPSSTIAANKLLLNPVQPPIKPAPTTTPIYKPNTQISTKFDDFNVIKPSINPEWLKPYQIKEPLIPVTLKYQPSINSLSKDLIKSIEDPSENVTKAQKPSLLSLILDQYPISTPGWNYPNYGQIVTKFPMEKEYSDLYPWIPRVVSADEGIKLNTKVPYYENATKQVMTPSDFTKLNARNVNLDLDLTDGSIDLENKDPSLDKDAEVVDLFNNEENRNETGQLAKTDKVKYFSVEVQTENRTVHVRIGKFSRNITVESFVTKFERLQNVTKSIGYWLDNPLINYIISKTPLAVPFNMLKTTVSMINNPKQAYKIFAEKYPVTSVFVDFAVAVYKDPKKIKDHAYEAIPKASQKIVEWHKKKSEEEAKGASEQENRSLVARKLQGFRLTRG